MAKKTWWQRHWGEVILIVGIAFGLYLTFKALGIIR